MTDITREMEADQVPPMRERMTAQEALAQALLDASDEQARLSEDMEFYIIGTREEAAAAILAALPEGWRLARLPEEIASSARTSLPIAATDTATATVSGRSEPGA